MDPESCAIPPACRGFRRSEQGFRRHAAEIEAIAAHEAAFDQNRAGAHLRRSGSDREPGRARADDAKIRLDPLRHSPVRSAEPLMAPGADRRRASMPAMPARESVEATAV